MAVLLTDLHDLVAKLRSDGRRVIGPVVRDEAIVLAELTDAVDLPYGWGVVTDAGRYRLVRRTDRAAFAHSAGPQAWKQYLHPQPHRLWSARRDGAGFEVTTEAPQRQPLALLGVRPCDLRAMGVLDRAVRRPRADVLVIAVNCTEPGGACFCVSAGGGPGAGDGYDIVLTELTEGFLAEAGSQAGAGVLDAVAAEPADAAMRDRARDAVRAAGQQMGRALPDGDLRTLLAAAVDSPRWAELGERCLACANCTLVCPTCFCTTVTDTTDLTGDTAQRWERWDSCFDLDFSYLHGGPVRTSRSSRYRQWLTHKLSTWHDQFGEAGCVGCGRCIVWCPVGIDITVEAAAFASEPAGPSPAEESS